MKIGLTVTTLLHDVNLVLVMNWLKLVNPIVDWCGAKLYVPNAVQTALLKGNWLEDYVKDGTVTVLSSEEELDRLKDKRIKSRIFVLKAPKFWKWQNDKINSRANLQKGDNRLLYVMTTVNHQMIVTLHVIMMKAFVNYL